MYLLKSIRSEGIPSGQKTINMKKITICTFSFAILFSTTALTQDSTKQTAAIISPVITYSGYVDAYAAYYTDSVGVGNYQQFPSVSPRNSLGLNVAMITAKYSADRLRGVVTLHYGDTPLSTWSSKYNFIQEANVGIRLCKKLWLDGGFFRTHVGAEGLFPKENIASAVSVCTFMEPYYEAGFKLNYVPSDRFSLNLFELNGYNIFEDNNNKTSGGMLVTYAFNDKLNVGYSNYIGDDSPMGDTVLRTRIYNNVFINYQSEKIKIQFGEDYAVQQTADPNDPAAMISGILSARYQCREKTAIYVRGEYFNDPDGFLSGTFTDDNGNLTGLKILGVTAGIEYKPTDNSYIRLEGRQLQAGEAQYIFRTNHKNTDTRMEAMIHMGVSF